MKLIAPAMLLVLAFTSAIVRGQNGPDVMIRPSILWNYGTLVGGGLTSQTDYISGVTLADTYLATNPRSGSGGWFGPGGLGFTQIGFDLGSTVSLTGMVVWQPSNFYNIAIARLELQVYQESSSQWMDIGWFTLGESSVERVRFAPVEARYVSWAVYQNYGNGFGTEVDGVAFTAAIPEPSSTAAMCGMLVLALVVWRRLHSRLRAA